MPDMIFIILHVVIFFMEEIMKKIVVFLASLFCAAQLLADDGYLQEVNACEYARKENSIRVWEEYLKAFPNGICRFEAENEIENLKNGKTKQEPEKNTVVVVNQEPVEYYRPHKGGGTALLVTGLLMDLVVSDALFIVGVNRGSSTMVGAGILTGVGGLAMWISGAVLLSEKKPVPHQQQKVEVSQASIFPTKGGMFASVGFKF